MNYTLTENLSPPGEIRRQPIPAFLVVDSFAAEQLPGFRSVGPMSRQMLYQAGHYNVNLAINYIEQTQAMDLMGQPIPSSADLSAVAGAEIELRQAADIICTTKANEYGSFILDGIREGVYELRIKLQNEEIEITNLRTMACPDREYAVN